MSILEYLAEHKVIPSSSVADIKTEIHEQSVSLEKALESRGITDQDLLSYKGEYYGVPTRDLSEVEVPFDILKYIPEESAMHYEFVPIAVSDGFLEVGMIDPSNIEARDALNFLSSKENLPFKIFIINRSDFNKVLEVYKGLSGEVTKALGELESVVSDEEEESIEVSKQPKQSPESNARIIEDAPVTKIVATVLKHAVEQGASDIHIEHMRERVRVRYRIDGVLETSLVLPVKVHNAAIARIKILAKLKLDEKRKPQDGRFSARIEGRKIDFRVSTFPTYYGEKVVMRILDQEKGIKEIDDIGLNDRYKQMLKNAIKRPYGMILVSGPTGSGKSTTLYSILKQIDNEKLNVLSLEDPVEYSIEGVSQSQVRADIGYTFATGLRTTLRQDPDVIMVGEIRDAETAKLAIQAALTGHLVFSTIHTNTAAGIVPRLIDMGVDPFLIAPTLILGIGQRLARKIAPTGGDAMSVEGSVEAMIQKQFSDLPEQFRSEIPKVDTIYKIKPSTEYPSGTKGREAVFEMFEMNKEIEDIILKSPVESDIYSVARKNGMITMKEDALIKALNGIIPFEEVNKLDGTM